MRAYFSIVRDAMWLPALLALSATLASALNLNYLNPTKLQTITSPETQEKAAYDVIKRNYPGCDWSSRNSCHKITVKVDPQLFRDNKDVFHIETVLGSLHIRASTGVAAAWGYNYYLKKYCKSQIGWQTKNLRIPDPLPECNETVVSNDRFRYYQNVCTASYSFAWWDVDDWRRHLTWMALNGINLALAPVAQEAAWQRIYINLGMTQDEIDQHFTGPAFLPWLRMGNVHGWGGPLPQSWHDLQTSIQNIITKSMLNLGIVPVMPTFNGHVPRAFARLFPNSTFHGVKEWNKFDNNYCCGLFLDPNDPMFRVIGKMFLTELSNVPNAHIYTADPFNEVSLKDFSTPLVKDTAQAIFGIINDFDDKSVWLLQNWMFVSDPLLWPINRVKSFLTAVPNGRMLVLDLQSEQWPQYDLYDMYYGQPFIWCMLHNFGGTLGMFGNMLSINKDVYEVRQRANSTMIGTGITPEGINQNYVVYDLMLESAWRKEPVADLETWAADYAERRYSCNSTGDAWKYLLKSVYSFNGLNKVRGKYVATRRPSLKIKPWAWYTSFDLFKAFRKLAFAADCHVSQTEGYLYDVVDVARQALQYRAEQFYMNVVSDRHTNTFVFKASVAQFLDVLQDTASVLRTNKHFTATPWFGKARSIAKHDDETVLYDINAKNQITMWGPNGEVSDYACKQWSELYEFYYQPRWAKFLEAATKAKELDEAFDEQATRRMVTSTVEARFISDDLITLMGPINDAVLEARRLYRKWGVLPGVEDLPVVVIKLDPARKTTLADADFDSLETSDQPSVVTVLTTPIR